MSGYETPEYGTVADCGSPAGEYGYEEDPELRDRAPSFLSNLNVPRNSICAEMAANAHSINSYNNGDLSRKYSRRLNDNPNQFARVLSEKLTGPWIEHAFEKRECIKFISQHRNADRCGCGRMQAAHSQLALSRFSVIPHVIHPIEEEEGAWSIAEHTQVSKTDAYGTMIFQGGAHAHKAHYVRLGYDSDPEDIMYLMEKVWNLTPPRLVISVQGGMSNFEVQEKLGVMFREGLLKAAQTTGAWIITAGVDSGVVRHVATALDEAGVSARMRSKIVIIGIAPWGVLRRRERLVGKDVVVQYDPHGMNTNSGIDVLNDRHSYFLLADNGTSGRHGADIRLRRAFESYLAESPFQGGRKIPVVCAVLEGGTNTITAVHQYLTGNPIGPTRPSPQVPVIACDGSGRASDLLAFACRYVDGDGSFGPEVRDQLLQLIAAVFPQSPLSPDTLLERIAECAAHRDLLTIYRLGEERQDDVDHAILTAILRRQNLSLPDQIALTLSWNRVDVCRSILSASGRNWPPHLLHPAMTDALRLNKIDFIKCFMEHGLNMKKYLSIGRLEQLYNIETDGPHNIHYLLEDPPSNKMFTLPEIGVIIERLMGSAYRCWYTTRRFKGRYEKVRRKTQFTQISRLSTLHMRLVRTAGPNKKRKDESLASESGVDNDDFNYPFNELLLWAVLTRRPEIAKCMWQHGEDALAKGLVAIRLFKAMSRIAEQEYLEMEQSKKLRECATEFRVDTMDLLDYCYQQSNADALKMLTAELPHWGHHTCLSLAVLANCKAFLAHPCCQTLLADLWHGNLRVRSKSNLRVIAGILLPPSALLLSSYKQPKDKGIERRMSGLYEDEEETIYESPDKYPVGPRDDRLRNSMGSLVSQNIMKIFRSSTKQPKQRETEELLESGSNTRKVKILSAKGSTSMYMSQNSLKKSTSLSVCDRMTSFYEAPITKFWLWCLSFHIFLCMFSYVLLIETPLVPTKIEWCCFVFMVSYGLEHLRKLLAVESPSLYEKCRVFFTGYWNFLTCAMLFTFYIGFAFRCQAPYRHSYGRVILSCSNVLCYTKVLDYLSIHPRLGPYITMAGKMVVSMMYIIILLLVVLMAFGVSRQAITFPHEKWHWLLVRNIFYKPYFMLYGEVYAGEIDTCGDEGVGSPYGTNCVPGGWIPPILMTVFLLVANILLINMLIAIFNNIFNHTDQMSQEVWLFQRYGQVMEYNDTPILPPPLTLLSHAGMVVGAVCRKKRGTGDRRQTVGMLDSSMKLYLDAEELRQLHDFEEDCMDELGRRKAGQRDSASEIARNLQISKTLLQRVNELLHENFSLKQRIFDIESRMDLVCRSQRELVTRMPCELGSPGRSVKSAEINSCRESSLSLPDQMDGVSGVTSNSMRRPAEYTSITDSILLAPPPCARLTVPSNSGSSNLQSPLLSSLRSDRTLLKYDDARYGGVQLSRGGLNASSHSVNHDLREMERPSRVHHSSSEESIPNIIVMSADTPNVPPQGDPPPTRSVSTSDSNYSATALIAAAFEDIRATLAKD